MLYLVINLGSSSIKCDIVDDQTFQIKESYFQPHQRSIENTLAKILKDIQQVDIVLHRVVHSGSEIKAFDKITPDTIQSIKEASQLAPLHNPLNLAGIQACLKLLSVPQYAIYDTGFFAHIPKHIYTEAIPLELRNKHHIRKYGFHGIAHEYLMNHAFDQLDLNPQDSQIITVQLGSGCSASLIKNGQAIDTSMDFTPLDGIIMSTRSGELDPGLVEYLEEINPQLDLKTVLNKESGLKALSQKYDNLKDIIEHKDTDPNCQLAYDAFTHSVARYIAQYAGFCSKLNAVVFGGGISYNAPKVTYDIMQLLPGVTPASHIITETVEAIQMVKTIHNSLS